MADEHILQKSHRGLSLGMGGGEKTVPSNLTHENITGFTVYPENLYLHDHVGKAQESSALFPEKKSKKEKEEKRKEEKTLKQTTGMQLHSISCSMLFLSQGLYRCTNWVEVGNGHESKPVFPSTLGLMRATCRNVGSHSTPLPHGLLQEGKEEAMPSFRSSSLHCGKTEIHAHLNLNTYQNHKQAQTFQLQKKK